VKKTSSFDSLPEKSSPRRPDAPGSPAPSPSRPSARAERERGEGGGGPISILKQAADKASAPLGMQKYFDMDWGSDGPLGSVGSVAVGQDSGGGDSNSSNTSNIPADADTDTDTDADAASDQPEPPLHTMLARLLDLLGEEGVIA
jgi:hypothetical protein